MQSPKINQSGTSYPQSRAPTTPDLPEHFHQSQHYTQIFLKDASECLLTKVPRSERQIEELTFPMSSTEIQSGKSRLFAKISKDAPISR